MSQKPTDHGAETRDTIVKSSLSGVAATVMAVTVFSPAGFGGTIGTSIASGFGVNPHGRAADDPYSNLPPFPSPMSTSDLDGINSTLARAEASLSITRAATDVRIEHLRAIAQSNAALTAASVAPMTQMAQLGAGMSVTANISAAAPTITATPVSFERVERDRHLELAELMFAHENI